MNATPKLYQLSLDNLRLGNFTATEPPPYVDTAVNEGAFELHVTSTAGDRFDVLRSTALDSFSPWRSNVPAGEEDATIITDPEMATRPHSFYQVIRR